MISKRRELHETAQAAESLEKRLKGMSDSLADDWETIVTDCREQVEKEAKKGKFKYFFDASNHSMKTTETLAAALKKELGDVIVVVSPRGIELNWESPE